MLTVRDEAMERVGTAHRAKLAYIYVRQSSAGQVRQHQESTELQYRLVDRAAGLGWPRERIEVIDDDLGKSGASGVERHGFQRLIAEIGLGKAGLVLSLDASRLARNNRDWHQLLELCSIFGVVIGDGERLYDPGAYHDRLLLGLSGIMSEAELHQIRMRLHQGERQKAARGELRMALPAGLVQERGGGIALNPDEEVQARLRFVFDKFRELQSAKAVMRELQRHGLPLPVRPLQGPAPHEVAWVPADSNRVLQILHNPAYAGTYAYGKRRQDPTRRRAGAARSATVKVAVEHWPVCLRDAHPGYIGWEEFMANQARLAGNAARHAAGRPGVPRRGCALLQGIAVCGRCGRRMGVRYSGPHGDYPVYHCSADQGITGQPRCQEVRALGADAEFERVLLEALAPDQIALAVAAVGQLEAETRALEHQWGLKRERARYEAERARRQYDAVEPENRLVARSLERAWEAKLRQAEAVEQALRNLARRADGRAGRHGMRRGPRPGPGSAARVAGRHGRGAQAHAAPGGARGRPRPEARARAGLDAHRLADRGGERAPGAASRAGLCGLRRHGAAGAADTGAERRRHDGPRDRGRAQRRGDRDRARHVVCRRERPRATQVLGYPDGQDQRRGCEPAALAGRQPFGAGRGRGARRRAADRVQVAAQGTAGRAATHQRPALADHAP